MKTFKLRIDFARLPETHDEKKCRDGNVPCRNCARKWLWLTHIVFDKGVNYLAHQLLAWRKGPGGIIVNGKWRDITAEEFSRSVNGLIVDKKLLEKCKSVCANHREVYDLMKAFQSVFNYACPASAAADGGKEPSQTLMSQVTRELYGPLVDPASEGLNKKKVEKKVNALNNVPATLNKIEGHPSNVHELVQLLKVLEPVTGGAGPRPAYLKAWQEFIDGKDLSTKASKKHRNLSAGFTNEQLSAIYVADLISRYVERQVVDSKQSMIEALGLLREKFKGKPVQPVQEIMGITGNIGEWGRSMFRMAMQKILSHIGWWNRRQSEILLQKKEEKLFLRGGWKKKVGKNKFTYNDILIDGEDTAPEDVDGWIQNNGYEDKQWFKELRSFEKTELPQMLEEAHTSAYGELLITPAMIKGWGLIRESWLKLDSPEERMSALNEMRGKEPEKYGDHRLFEWLAERPYLWNGKVSYDDCDRHDGDCISAYVRKYNTKFRIKKLRSITFTEVDHLKHPVWMFFAESSAVKYKLKFDGESLGAVVIEVLRPSANGLERKQIELPVQKNKDLDKSVVVHGDSKFSYADDLLAGITIPKAEFGEVKLVWSRRDLDPLTRSDDRQKFVDTASAEAPKSARAYFFIGLSIPKVSGSATEMKKAGKLSGPFDEGRYLISTKARESKDLWKIGTRIFSVDLGIRHGAAYAIWEVTKEKTPHDVGNGVYVKRIRDGTIDLPGDGEDLPDKVSELAKRVRETKTLLNAQRSILQIVRLFSETTFVRFSYKMDPIKKKNRIRVKRKTVRKVEKLPAEAIEKNARKAADMILRWLKSDPIGEDLEVLLKRVGINSEDLSSSESREKFLQQVIAKKNEISKMLADGYDASKPKRVQSGLWKTIDERITNELSYGTRTDGKGKRKLNKTSLLRLVREKVSLEEAKTTVNDSEIPSGKTLRGGLSAARIRFLKDFETMLRKWTTRPRWPGDVRHLPTGQNFSIEDSNHLDNLRDDRIKKLAFAMIAHALGFLPDLKTGLWKFPDKDGNDLWLHPESKRMFIRKGGILKLANSSSDVSNFPIRIGRPCDIMVFEDLKAYQYRQDMPRGENRQLMLWSHRRLLGLVIQMADLYDLPICTTWASYSSRLCSLCGSPGFRVDLFKKDWFDSQPPHWIDAMLKSDNKNYAQFKKMHEERKDAKKEFYFISRGGTEFACSNANCDAAKHPINADINAASNIGRRFMHCTTAAEIFTCKAIESDGILKVSYPEKMKGTEMKWLGTKKKLAVEVKSGSKQTKQASPQSASEEEADDKGDMKLFRDPSGSVFSAERWYLQEVFWFMVRSKVSKNIKGANVGTEVEIEEDEESES